MYIVYRTMQVEFLKVLYNYNYSVSNTGLVRNDVTGKILKPSIINGYHVVEIPDDGKKRRFRVHRLVADVHIDNTECKPYVFHIDNNRSNNHITNLRWCRTE